MARSEIEGLKELMKQLEKMGEEGQKMTEDILKESAKIMKDEIERQAPDDKEIQKNNEKYGKLNENIKLEYDANTQTVFITSNAPWGAVVEYGSRKRKKNPFMERSYLNKKDDVQKEIIKLAKKRMKWK